MNEEVVCVRVCVLAKYTQQFIILTNLSIQ